MKKHKLAFILVFVMGLGYFPASAQKGEFRMTASLAAAIPTGDLKELTDKISLRGADINFIYGINEHWGAGLNIGFQDFYEKFPRGVYKLADGSDISAVVTNSIQTIPFLATAKYKLANGVIQPYASAGLGGSVVIYRQFLGEAANDYTRVSFAARPGLGVFWPFKKDGAAGINLGVNYNFIAYKENGVSNLNYFGVTLGIGFPARD